MGILSQAKNNTSTQPSGGIMARAKKKKVEEQQAGEQQAMKRLGVPLPKFTNAPLSPLDKMMLQPKTTTPPISGFPINKLNNKIDQFKQGIVNTGLSGLGKGFDLLSRPQNAVSNAFRAQTQNRLSTDFTKRVDVGQAFIKGITGKERPDVFETLMTPKQAEKVHKNLNPTVNTLLDMLITTSQDPTMILGVGTGLLTKTILGKVGLVKKMAKGAVTIEDIAQVTGKTEKELQAIVASERAVQIEKANQLLSTAKPVIDNRPFADIGKSTPILPKPIIGNQSPIKNALAQDTLKPQAQPFTQVKVSTMRVPKRGVPIETTINKVSTPMKGNIGMTTPSTTIQKGLLPQRGSIQVTQPVLSSRTLTPTGLKPQSKLGRELKAARNDINPQFGQDNLVKTFDDINATTLKDTSGFNAYTNDINRIFKKVFGKDFAVAKKEFLDPFDAAKKANIETQGNWLNSMKQDVVDKFNIKKGSKESAAVQWYGEKKRLIGTEKVVDPQTGKIVKKANMVEYTLDNLKKDFPNKWQDIQKADTWFRTHYDDAIDQINASRKTIYPNAEQNVAGWAKAKTDLEAAKGTMSKDAYNSAIQEINIKIEDAMRGKLVPKRNDYYRHFRELQDTVQGVKNLFDTPSQINPSLAGISDFTKPKSKWASFMQRRGLGQYKADAVGGFIQYTKPASYAIHIDPQIQKFRNLGKDLAVQTNDSKNLNKFIEYIGDFADSLAGKSGHILDRGTQKVVGRKAMNILNWGNSRVKANTVLGNASSSLSQIANIPQGIAYVKNPKHLAQGAADTIASIINKNNPMKDSGFLMERYSGKLYSQFDHRIIDQPKKFAAWLLNVGDEVGTKFIWNSVYRKGLADGVENALKNADDVTRGLVAGRGIGEVPLMQQEKIFQLVAPFQLEVGNLWHVMGDRVSEKDFGGLATLLVANYVFNRGMEQVRGSGVVFDPIKAIQDSVTEKNPSVGKTVGRLAGEVLSNIPLGQNLAATYPEFGNFGGLQLPTRKELFGKEDPTRFGSGLVVTKGLQDPLYKLLPSFGGAQAKKTIEGLTAVKNKGVMNGDKLNYPVQQTPSNILKGALFGKGGLKETKDYYDNNRRALSSNQTKDFNILTEQGANPQKLYDFKMIQRESQAIEMKMTAIAKDDKLTDAEKRTQIKSLYIDYQKANEKFKGLQK